LGEYDQSGKTGNGKRAYGLVVTLLCLYFYVHSCPGSQSLFRQDPEGLGPEE